MPCCLICLGDGWRLQSLLFGTWPSLVKKVIVESPSGPLDYGVVIFPAALQISGHGLYTW